MFNSTSHIKIRSWGYITPKNTNLSTHIIYKKCDLSKVFVSWLNRDFLTKMIDLHQTKNTYADGGGGG